MCIQNLVKFCPFFVKILSGNEILTPIKGRNLLTNLQKKTHNNTNVDLINIDLYTKFSQNMSIYFKIMSGKETQSRAVSLLQILKNIQTYIVSILMCL